MELYVFGSFCRGEVDQFSDIDLLLIKKEEEPLANFDLNKFSIYNRSRIISLWQEGNPFSWHLFLEGRLIFSRSGSNLIEELGAPNPYQNLEKDLKKFLQLFLKSKKSLISSVNSRDFDLSMIFLSIRNFASCYALGFLGKANFSRRSALNLDEDSIPISIQVFHALERARILSTRGIGELVTSFELELILVEIEKIEKWFYYLLTKLNIDE